LQTICAVISHSRAVAIFKNCRYIYIYTYICIAPLYIYSTDQGTFLLKQTASYFETYGSSVHAVFLDTSKAFDRELRMKLFEKLIQRKVPMCFVRLLKHWYKEQTLQLKWGKHFSKPFHVSNGVRQGRVLSPYLFAAYFDDLSNELNNIKAGCSIGEVILNHLMFVDDICVFCLIVRWLQRILDVCQAYAESHCIIFNCNKTVCISHSIIDTVWSKRKIC